MQHTLCHICFKNYQPTKSPMSPTNLMCGHTICHGCFLELKDCPVCRSVNKTEFENKHGLKGSYNYEFNSLLEDPDKEKNEKDLRNMKNIHFCYDCQHPFKKTSISFLRDFHQSHKTTPLEGKDIDQVKDFLWIHQNRNVDLNGAQPLDGFLRCMVILAWESLFAVSQISSLKAGFSRNLDEPLQELIKGGIQSLQDKHKELVDAHLILKRMHDRLYVPVLSLMEDCAFQIGRSVVEQKQDSQICGKSPIHLIDESKQYRVPDLDTHDMKVLIHVLQTAIEHKIFLESNESEACEPESEAEKHGETANQGEDEAGHVDKVNYPVIANPEVEGNNEIQASSQVRANHEARANHEEKVKKSLTRRNSKETHPQNCEFLGKRPLKP